MGGLPLRTIPLTRARAAPRVWHVSDVFFDAILAMTSVSPALSLAGAEPDARRSFKADQVYATLKEAILSGGLAPGLAIDKPALCERLGMSRFPVSAAINRLAFEKLVVIEPQHGSFVSRISLIDVREFMLLRRAVEGDLAAAAAERGSPDLGEALSHNLDAQAGAAAAGDPAGFYALDVLFHQAIVESLGLLHAAEMLSRLLSHLERVRRLLSAPPSRAPITLAAHRSIAAAIGARDTDAARAAARAHLDDTSALFESFARQNPTLFAEADHA